MKSLTSDIGLETGETVFTVSEAASLVGRSPDTLRRWRVTGVFKPSMSVAVGKLTVPLYTPEDVVAMKTIAKDMRPGRKKNPKES